MVEVCELKAVRPLRAVQHDKYIDLYRGDSKYNNSTTERQVFEADGIDSGMGSITAQAVNSVVETAITTVSTNILELVMGHQTYNSRAIIICHSIPIHVCSVSLSFCLSLSLLYFHDEN